MRGGVFGEFLALEISGELAVWHGEVMGIVLFPEGDYLRGG